MNHVLKLKTLADLYKTIAKNVTLGKENAEATLFQQGLLPINVHSVDSLGYASKAQNLEIKVEVTTLDKVISGLKESSVDILKIDVQGIQSRST